MTTLFFSDPSEQTLRLLSRSSAGLVFDGQRHSYAVSLRSATCSSPRHVLRSSSSCVRSSHKCSTAIVHFVSRLSREIRGMFAGSCQSSSTSFLYYVQLVPSKLLCKFILEWKSFAFRGHLEHLRPTSFPGTCCRELTVVEKCVRSKRCRAHTSGQVDPRKRHFWNCGSTLQRAFGFFFPGGAFESQSLRSSQLRTIIGVVFWGTVILLCLGTRLTLHRVCVTMTIRGRLGEDFLFSTADVLIICFSELETRRRIKPEEMFGR